MSNSFDERAKKAVEAVADLAKQLITLSTGVIAITISFGKDVFGTHTRGNGLVMGSWAVYLVCIMAGIWVLMAIAGTLDPAKPPETTTDHRILRGNVRVPAGVQVLAFVVATALVGVAGAVEAGSGAAAATGPTPCAPCTPGGK